MLQVQTCGKAVDSVDSEISDLKCKMSHSCGLSFPAATNGHSECLRLLIGNADLQSAVDIQDGNGQ